MRTTFVFLCTALGAAPAVAAGAQDVQLGVAGGVAVPTGRYGETRSTGPLVRGTLLLGDPRRHVRLRADVEGAWLLDEDGRATAGSSHDGTMRALGAFASVVVGGTGPRFAPYLVAGAGAQRLRVAGVRNPYGTTLGVRAGGGVRWHLGRALLYAEVAAHGALTDFGTGRDFAAGSYVPVVVGVSF